MKQESNPVLVRARMWAWAPEELRARTWPRLEPVLISHAEAAGLNPALAFPSPIKNDDTNEESPVDRLDRAIDSDKALTKPS
jgi:hypothetical protein